MADKNEPTVEEAREVIEQHAAVNPKGLASETDQSSGIVMKANKVDPSVLTYDPKDVEQDKDVAKRAADERKAEEQAKK
jgi:hypothetical protein